MIGVENGPALTDQIFSALLWNRNSMTGTGISAELTIMFVAVIIFSYWSSK